MIVLWEADGKHSVVVRLQVSNFWFQQLINGGESEGGQAGVQLRKLKVSDQKKAGGGAVRRQTGDIQIGHGEEADHWKVQVILGRWGLAWRTVTGKDRELGWAQKHKLQNELRAFLLHKVIQLSVIYRWDILLL